LVEAPLRNDSVQVVYTLVMPSSVFGTGQWAVTLCGWEGNRGSGIALAMRHRLQRSNCGLKECEKMKGSSASRPTENAILAPYELVCAFSVL